MTEKKKPLRLNSFLSRAGIAARRKCDQLILDGFVRVNGKVILEPGTKVDIEQDVVTFRSRRVYVTKNFEYILLNKPKGYICSLKDEHKRKTVTDLVKLDRRIYPVGRLDTNTTGTLLLTDDGELSYRLMHPKYQIEKKYVAEVHKPVKDFEMRQLNKRVEIGEREYVSAKVRKLSGKKPKLEFTVHEGKNHLIKRMAGAVRLQVVSLERTRFAGLHVRKLPKGCWRALSKKEIKDLYKMVGMAEN